MVAQANNIRHLPVEGPKLFPGGVLLSSVEPERIEWLCPDRVAVGKVSIIDGDPGLGKSVITVDWAARVSQGIPLPGADGWMDGPSLPPRGVILLSGEDGLADTIVPRAIAAGADRRHILAMHMTDEKGNAHQVFLDEHLWAIESQIEAMNAQLVVIDPIMAYLGKNVKSNSDQDVRSVLMPLAAMAERTRCAVVVLRHLNKSAGTNAVYRGGGSIGIIGSARVGMLAGKDVRDDTGERRLLAVSKSNIGKIPPALAYRLVQNADLGVVQIDWLGESVGGTEHILQEIDAEEREDMSDSQQWLFDFLSTGAHSARDVFAEAKKDGFSERTMKRAKKAIGVVSIKNGFEKGAWQWQLPTKEGGDIRTVSTPNGHHDLFDE